jgi:hypothetical protein
MSSVNPSEYEAGRWIKETLAAAGCPAAYLDVIPTDASMPAIRFSCQTRNDVRTNAQHIAISTWRFLVVGAAFSHDAAGAADLADQIDAALPGATGSTAKLGVIACTRVQTYGQTSPEQGGMYRLGGAIYEVVGAAAS